MHRRALAWSFLALLLVPISAHAAPPWDEINDVLWCVDQSSRTVGNVVHQYGEAIARTWDENYRNIKCKLHQRPRIDLSSDPLSNDPATLLAQYGIVRGTGSAADPYVIENWEIAGSDTAHLYAAGFQTETPSVPEQGAVFGSGIFFGDVKKHYVVDKVYVHGFNCELYEVYLAAGLGQGQPCDSHPEDGFTAIVIAAEGTSRITIRNSLLVDNTNGIAVRPGNALITNNEIRADWVGIKVDVCPWCTHQRVDVIGNRIYVPQGPQYQGSGSIQTTHGIFFAGGIVAEEVSQNRLKGMSVGAAFWGTRPYGHSNTVCAHERNWIQTHDQPVGWWWDCISP